MINFNPQSVALAIAAAITVPHALPASAQSGDGADTIEEIFVLGTRRAYQGNIDYMEDPTVVQRIDEELLRDAGVLNLNQALDLSASVARQNNFGGLWNAFSVRGFSGDINVPSGFLVNGFNAGRGFGGPRDIIGIESVEVLKGPRSAIFGRGEPGGTVNLVTKRPKFGDAGATGFVRATVGKWDQYRFEGDVNFTSDDDRIGVRLVGFYEDAESFRRTVETEKIGFYPSVTWNVSDATRVTYELEYTEQEIPFDRGVVFSDTFGFSPRRTFGGEPGDGPIDTEVLGHQLELQHAFSDQWSLLVGFGYRDTEFEGNASEYNFGGRQLYLRDGQTLTRFFRFRDFDSDYTVFRAELAGQFETGALKHRLLFGADYDDFDTSTFIQRFRPPFVPADADISTLDPATYLFLNADNPVYGQFPIPVPGPNTDREEEFTGFGLYVQDQIDITEQLQIRLGLRFDDFDQELTNLRATPASTLSSSDDRVSPQVGAVYLINEGVSVYASYGEGFRQQTGATFEGDQPNPNLTESAEVGVKFALEHFFDNVAGSVSVTAFQVDQDNFLVNDARPEAVAAGFFVRAAGEARSRGLEIDANLATESGFKLWFSYAYTDAEFRNSFFDESGFGGQINPGDALINAPENQLSIQLSQSFNVGAMPAQIGGGLQYTDERAGWQGFDFTLPDFTTVRLFGEIQPVDGLTVRADIDNLFNETFYTNSFADVWVEPGAPRRYRVTASYSF